MIDIRHLYPNGKPEAKQFDVLPAGDYKTVISEIDEKLTKKAQEANRPSLGTQVVIRFEIVDGPQKGRSVFGRYLIAHESEKAVEIASENLAAICEALGVDASQVSDLSLAVGKMIQVKTKVRRDEGYGEQPEIVGYKSAAGKSVENIASESSQDDNPF